MQDLQECVTKGKEVTLFNERKLVKVYVEEEEWKGWQKKAAIEQMSLSAWIRERCNGEVPETKKHNGVAELPSDGGVRVVEGRANTAKRLEAHIPRKTCPHGIEKGWRCTLCGGIVS